jgi:WD40 repeat protein
VLNQIVAHYRVLQNLGGGGMGVVYRAEGLKLKREVALKFLPEDVIRDPVALERFEREAEAAAAINHPNICTVYEIGDFRLGDLAAGQAASSPDGQRVVYTQRKERDVALSDGSEGRKLVTLPGTAFFPRWSPDGKTIRFTVGDMSAGRSSVSARLWEVSSDGSHLHALFTNWREAQCCGSWTPDGRYFVFTAIAKGVETVWALREKVGLFERIRSEPRAVDGRTDGHVCTGSPARTANGFCWKPSITQ